MLVRHDQSIMMMHMILTTADCNTIFLSHEFIVVMNYEIDYKVALALNVFFVHLPVKKKEKEGPN